MNSPTITRNPVLQTAVICIGLYALANALFYTRELVVPLLFGTLFAILLDAPVNLVTRLRIGRTPAILIVLVFAMALALGLVILIGYHGSSLVDDLPKLMGRLSKVATSIGHWVAETTGIGDEKMNAWYEKTRNDQMKNSSVIVGKTLSNLDNLLSVVFLLPVYIFMLLYYKSHLVEFLRRKLLHKGRERILGEILGEIKSLVQFYLVGLMTELFIVAGLNALGLYIIGVDYAILLGLITGVLNLIPYLGGIIAGALAMIVAVSSSTPFDAIWVLVLFSTVQFIDNTFIVPLVVGSRVKLNAFISLIGVIAGGALWGIPGMILSIPLLGVLKVIFDKSESMQAWGFLLGDREAVPVPSRVAPFIQKLRRKK